LSKFRRRFGRREFRRRFQLAFDITIGKRDLGNIGAVELRDELRIADIGLILLHEGVEVGVGDQDDQQQPEPEQQGPPGPPDRIGLYAASATGVSSVFVVI
jgi:hypothetical protein